MCVYVYACINVYVNVYVYASGNACGQSIRHIGAYTAFLGKTLDKPPNNKSKAIGKVPKQGPRQGSGRALSRALGSALGRALGKGLCKAFGRDLGRALGKAHTKCIRRAIGMALIKALGKALGRSMGKAQCMAAGANIFLTKPIVANELFDSIRFVRRQAHHRAETEQLDQITANARRRFSG